ncbi:WD40 repeat-like protein [Auriculariales sp. MPI-PUGE-AT-0066]|nr:WD40 repeat-like protein [Auriculariales sp. MPI-PUGE-AT-0066]
MSSSTTAAGSSTAPEKPSAPTPNVVRPFTTFQARGLIPPNFSAWRPRDTRNQPAKEIGWSCDGKYLAVCGNDKAIRVWQPDRTIDLRGATSLTGAHGSSVDCITWHPSHPEILCSASKRDTKFVQWDTRTQKPVQTLNLTRRPLNIQYAPDGSCIMVVDDDDRLSFIKPGEMSADGRRPWTYGEASRPGPDAVPAYSAVWSHSSNAFFIGDSSGSVRVMENQSMEVLEKMNVHIGPCYVMALDPRGKYLATGGADSIVNLIGLDQWLPVRAISCFDGTVMAMSFSYDGEYIAVAGDNPFLDIIASETGEVVHRIAANPSPQSVAWHPVKHALAYCGEASGPGTGNKGTISVFMS